jgi:hypothetical protein
VVSELWKRQAERAGTQVLASFEAAKACAVIAARVAENPKLRADYLALSEDWVALAGTSAKQAVHAGNLFLNAVE